MSRIRVIVVSPEEAYDGIAEFCCGAALDEANRLTAVYRTRSSETCHDSRVCPVFARAGRTTP